ncbi:MAG: cobyrinate a,c-diamide synthase [Alphaproteobacteria bacterium]|nr:cobyrinate a,c-diamide synthase [Alphaproteobacteria bacterium]
MTGGIVIAAPKSGSGKTLIVGGLLRHLCASGVRVAAAKCGPDFIDPTFHALASGAPCLNLDTWAMRPATLAGLVCELQATAELVLCEGVMGLFDGAGPDGEAGSTAELARRTGWPVVLVVDASGQGASVAALVAGFARHDPRVPLGGVILNRVASAQHGASLRAAMGRHLPELPVLGCLLQDDDLVLGGRHLGLVPAAEAREADAVLDRAATAVSRGIDIERLLRLAQGRPRDGAAGPMPLPPLGQHIAVARDDAFLFVYEASLAGWRRQGAEISAFSPLADEPPDPAADAVYLPGGYPELHAGSLAAAGRFLAGLREAAVRGAAMYGECGGYMTLGETLTDANGSTHRLAGLLPLATSFARPRRHLGYRSATLLADGMFGHRGARFRGHEFHYAYIVEEQASRAGRLFATADAGGTDRGLVGLRLGNVAGSFIHLIDRAD